MRRWRSLLGLARGWCGAGQAWQGGWLLEPCMSDGLQPTASRATSLSTAAAGSAVQRVLREAYLFTLSGRLTPQQAAPPPAQLQPHHSFSSSVEGGGLQVAAGGGGLSPLQRCLAEFGLSPAEVAAFDIPRYHCSAYTEERVAEDVQPKLALLRAEGLAPADVATLFKQRHNMLGCPFATVFKPNWDYLRGLLAGMKFERNPKTEPEGLTALGRLLRNQPAGLAQLLSRDPALVAGVECWVVDVLGVTRAQLAKAASKVVIVLLLPLDNARAVAEYLQSELGMTREQAAKQLLRDPRTYSTTPAVLRANVAGIEAKLGTGNALALALAFPMILGSRLPQVAAVLAELDGLFGQEGVGLRLVQRQPRVAAISLARLRANVEYLRGKGYSSAANVAVIARHPTLLACDLSCAAQQQKEVWGEKELGLSFGALLAGKYYSHNLRRVAGRLDFVRHLGLEDPESLYSLSQPDSRFFPWVSRRAGRVVTEAEYEAWLGGWLQTPRGREYGFPPPKPKRAGFRARGDTKKSAAK